ncbi:type VI secretion system tip protein VgrG [Chitinophaga alhagiae]|uniref:type VI secretion system tip protein VgrG n=1 Tax=Chitinophaga alhagiae TaxID=2203219 RepID=UPI000E5A7342|nr:type VI secretion system tip protein VgrG [Chitinophaga alhagiae]
MPENRDIQTSATPSVATLTILSGGQQVARTYQVAAVTVTREINRIPAATIVIQDGDAARQTFPASDGEDFIPGKEIEIKAGYRGQDETIFKGVVVRNTLKVRKNVSLFTVECRDKIFPASLTPASKYYKEQKDSEIIEDILSKYQVQKEVGATSVKHPVIAQYNLSDWDFMLQRAEAAGLCCIMENGKGIIKKPDLSQQPVETVQYGSSLLELDLEMDARTQPDTFKAYTWDHSAQELTEVEAAEPSGTLNGNISAKDLAQSASQPAPLLRLNSRIPVPELQAMADAMLQQARLAKITGRANFQGTARIKPGTIVALKGTGKRFEGNVFIQGVRHQVVNGNWTTDAQIGLQPNQPLLQPPLPLFRPAQQITSLQVGIVTQLENDPDGEDRILVVLPFIDGREEGMWARVSTLDAGNKRGSFFRPEIKDEVLVGFIDGNPNAPVVLGGLNSSALPAPLSAQDSNDEKGFVTRSEMKMLFDDAKKSFRIETPGANKLTISDDDESIKIEDQHGNKIVMNSDGISIESPKNIQLKATADLKAEGKTAAVKATLGFKADGGGGCELSAGNGITAVKGGLVQIN